MIDRALLVELEQAVGREAYLGLFTTLLDQLRLSAQGLEEALTASDWPEVERHAHSIVSPAGHLGALKLATAARDLSQRARTLNLGTPGGTLEPGTLEKEADAVRVLVERSLGELVEIEAETGPAG